MASTGRPSRLLNLQKSPASNKAIAAQNATTSPFLKLPPEIRQRIYGYALGGRILHVASGPMLGPNRVVVCVNSDDFTDSADRQMIHGIRDGIVEVKNRGVTHSQLESHKKCYQAHATWSLNLLGVCRQIYHEAVLTPFSENTFAVAVSTAIPPCLPTFLSILVPAQLRAIQSLIIQHTKFTKDLRLSLTRLKGLKTLQYILVGAEDHLKKFAFREFFEVKGKLGDYGLPPKCDVRVRVRPVLGFREAATEMGRVERVEDGLMELVERARKQILGGSGSARKWRRGERKDGA